MEETKMKNIKKIISGALLSATLLGSGLMTSSMACPFDQDQFLQGQIQATHEAIYKASQEQTSSAWFEAENCIKAVIHTLAHRNDPSLNSLKDQFYQQANNAKLQAAAAKLRERQIIDQSATVEDVSLTTLSEISNTNLSQKTSPLLKIED